MPAATAVRTSPSRRGSRRRRITTLVGVLAALGVASCTPDSTTGQDLAGPGLGGAPGQGAALRPGSPAPWLTPGERLGIAGCPLFPTDHAWHATVTPLSPLPESAATVALNGGATRTLEAGFSSGVWQGSRAGIPTNTVDSRVAAATDVEVLWDGDTGAEVDVPIPSQPRFEGWPGRAWDVHLLSVDSATCTSRELLNVRDPSVDTLGLGGGRWYADSAATFDLRSNDAPGWGATAAMSSLLAGLVRFDEVAAGSIDHAISVTFAGISSGPPVWPALGTDGGSASPGALPMGSWLRLRPDTDLSALGPQSQVVARALQEHGAIINDTGPGFTLQGEPDLRWDDRDLDSLAQLSLDDFEVVDASPMMVSPDSYQLRPQV